MSSPSPNPFLSDADFEVWYQDTIRPRRLLLIDDDLTMHEIIAHTLKKFNCELFSAYDGFQGVEMFLEVKPDLVWLDFRLGAMDGVDVFREIRRREKQDGNEFSPTPVIFVSGYLDSPMIERIHSVGIALLLRKPDDIRGPKLMEVFKHFHIQPRRKVDRH